MIFARFLVCLLFWLPIANIGFSNDDHFDAIGHFGLEIDGTFVGWLDGVEGGSPVGSIVTEIPRSDGISKKHIDELKFEDITFRCGAGMSKEFYQWIQNVFEHKAGRKSGAIISVDRDNREQSRLIFSNAFITEIGLPALDAAGRELAYMTIKISPEGTKRTIAAGAIYPRGLQKNWIVSNFRLNLDGLDHATSRISKVDALIIKQLTGAPTTGLLRRLSPEPTALEFSNLIFTLPQHVAASLYDWEDSFLLRGENSDNQEKAGQLVYLSPDLRTVLFSVKFSGVGLVRLTTAKLGAGANEGGNLTTELYCEDLSLQLFPNVP